MRVLHLQAVEDVGEYDLQHVERLEVVLLDLHLNVKPGELGEVPALSVMFDCVRFRLVHHLWELLVSARKTGPISNTRSKSLHMDICLYSCGLCARQACCWKYLEKHASIKVKFSVKCNACA